jgi:hypothetical protein
LDAVASREGELEGEEGRKGDGVAGLLMDDMELREKTMGVHNIVYTFNAGYKSLQVKLMMSSPKIKRCSAYCSTFISHFPYLTWARFH